MMHAVDMVYQIIRNLGPSEPVMFQRDGSLWIVSEEGFGQVTYGLDITPNRQADGCQPNGVTESKDAIFRWVSDGYDKKPYFRKGERKILEHMLHGPDDSRFSLEEITASAKRLSEIPDDGQIRMVNHLKSHHSHKYGYSMDGVDVWVANARVMDREKYLKLVRQKEDVMYLKLENIHEQWDDFSHHSKISFYNTRDFPDCVVMTPYMLASFPRYARLDRGRDGPDSWTNNTMLSQHWGTFDNKNNGSILELVTFNYSQKSPYAVYIKTNGLLTSAAEAREFNRTQSRILEKISSHIGAVHSVMTEAETFLSRYNELHNAHFKEEIEEYGHLYERPVI